MRYIYACFKGYIGFYNGMGLEKVEIDFTKCKNNIILIHGANGTGKSTLLNSLNPFPDSSSSFVPNIDAEKILKLFHAGDTYLIRIVSPADTKGGRKVTKAFISKNGLELNDNGNISSYKEIIFSEFDLDSNYASLTRLSSNDRGMGDKTPAERKKFVSAIIENLETYNSIYKTLNKKSLIFKSHINNLHTKIQNIGMKDNLEITLRNLQEKFQYLSDKILSFNNKIVELETRSMINKEEADKIQELETQKASIKAELDSIEVALKLCHKSTRISPEDIESKLQENCITVKQYTSQLESIRIQWITESEKMNSLVNSINELKSNREMYSTDMNLSVEEKYMKSKSKIENLKSQIISNGIEPDITFIEPLSQLLDFYKIFISKLYAFYDGLTTEDLNYIVLRYDKNKLYNIQTTLSDTLTKISNTQKTIDDIRDKLKLISVLDKRPVKCNINECPFISEAVKLKNELGDLDLVELLSELQTEIMNLSSKTTEYVSDIDRFTACDKKRKEYDEIISLINSNQSLFVMFNDQTMSNLSKIQNMISLNSQFNFQRDPKMFIDTLNWLKELKSETQIFSVIEMEYNLLKNKLEMINKASESINRLEKELKETTQKVSEIKRKKDALQLLVDSVNNLVTEQSKYVKTLEDYNRISEKYNNILSKIKEIENKSSDSIKNIMQINELKREIDILNNERNPISIEINRISGQLTMLESYYKEYEAYKIKYDTIETLKKYCSPTSGGIQTLFMQLYMSKTLELANQVLGLLFGGEYKLLDFVINQNEFRIPFVGSGLPVDDISSGSNSQIAIMGMAINLVLFHQASTKYNIARLDEIDAPLDSRNRYEFVNALYRTLPILNIEQLFIISHSMESDTSAVDIIKLKSYNDFDSSTQLLGNVIYDYTNEITKTSN